MHPTTDTTTSIPPIAQVQVSQPPGTDTHSVLTGTMTTTPMNKQHQSTSMAVVTLSPPVQGSTTAASMDSGPNTLLCQLMSNASA